MAPPSDGISQPRVLTIHGTCVPHLPDQVYTDGGLINYLLSHFLILVNPISWKLEFIA